MKCQQRLMNLLKAIRKKEIKRSSFYSGYTASTNDDKASKRNSKKLTEERRREMYEEGANSIKGWLEFRMLILSSFAYASIKEAASKRTPPQPMRLSQASTIKHEPLEKFYLTEYQHDNSISIARELPHNISGSLVYTADQNFEFTQKDVTLTTPEKFGSEDRLSTPPLPNYMRKACSNQESFVESYKPKEIYSPQAKPVVSREKIVPTISQPIKLAETEERRYLTVRTNIYELPMLSGHELRADRQKIIPDPSHLGDHFTRNQPESCENTDAMVKELKQVIQVKSKAKASEIAYPDREANLSKLNDRKSYGSRAVDSKKVEVEGKKLATSPAIPKDEKKDVQKIENNYYFNENGSPKTSRALPSPNLHIEKKSIEQIKSVESILKTSKPEKKSEKQVRIEESVVNQFNLEKGKQAFTPFAIKSQARAEEKTQPWAYQPEYTERRDERVKSRSKLNIMMQPQPQRKESPRVNIYHPAETIKIDNKPIPRVSERDRHVNSPYGYSTPNEKPRSPIFTHHEKNVQSPRVVSPIANQQVIYQMNQGPAYPKPAPTTPHRIISQVKSSQQLKIPQQQSPRVDPAVRNSPGKVINPTYLITSQDRRMVGAPSQLRLEEKKSFYSPQMVKDAYFLSPEKPIHPVQQAHKVQAQNVRRMYSEQEYFSKESNQVQLRAVNFNNNYYTSGPQTSRQPVAEPLRNVFQQQEEPARRQGYLERPPSCRQSGERNALFNNYSPLDSELESQQRSNHFSKNSSELSRPKSMNEKIFITLRKDK